MMQMALQTIILKVTNRAVVLFEKTVRGKLPFKNMLLKEQVKVLEEEKNKLEEELKCSNVYAGSLKSRLFTYDTLMKNYLDQQLA